MPETRYSMVKAYRRCPKSYDYKYNQNLQRRKPSAPLLRGTIIHELLDSRAIKGPETPRQILSKYAKQFKALFLEEQEHYGPDFLGDIWRIFEGYERTYAEENIKYESSEEFVATDLTSTLRYTGHLDKRVVTLKDGRRWIMDHKSHRTIPTEEQRFSAYQILLYVWAYNRERPNDQVDGVIWDYIRTKAPTIPEQLKNGELSQAKKIDTDVFTYEAEIERLDLDPKPYREFLRELERRSKDRFYHRVFLPNPGKAMIETVVEEFKQTSLIMKGITVYPRTLTPFCSFCEYYRLCSAELRGLDHNFIRKTEYEEKEIGEDYSEEIG